MEAMLQPPEVSDSSFVGRLFFRAIRSSLGEWLILEQNLFIENILPRLVIRLLTEEEMTHYRAPYLEPGEDRRALLT